MVLLVYITYTVYCALPLTDLDGGEVSSGNVFSWTRSEGSSLTWEEGEGRGGEGRGGEGRGGEGQGQGRGRGGEGRGGEGRGGEGKGRGGEEERGGEGRGEGRGGKE